MCLLLGGPTYRISIAGGKLVPFEMHPYCGPHPVHKITGDPLLRIPAGFWDAIERWIAGGKKLEGDLCVLPDWCSACDGTGDETRHRGGRHWEIVGRCKKCQGNGWMFDAIQGVPAP